MKKLLMIAAIALYFAGCSLGDNNNSGPPYEPPFEGQTSVAEVRRYINSTEMRQRGLSPDDPIELAVKIDASEWDYLLEAVAWGGKFVSLDLSNCYNVPQAFNYEISYIVSVGSKLADTLVSISLPEGITAIRSSAFYGCA